jgi:hypothetical protein
MGFLGRLCPSTRYAALLLLLLFGVPGRSTQPNEQSSFSEDGPLQSPATLSPEVLRLLLATDAAKEGLPYANASQRANPAQLFRAAEVHLSQPGQTDLVIIGVCPMCGADTGWFWIVSSVGEHPKVVLAAGGKTLEVLNSSSKAYHDIQSLWSSASETVALLYRFNGVQYELHKRKSSKTATH